MRLVFSEQGIFFVRAARREELNLDALSKRLVVRLLRVGLRTAVLFEDQGEPLFQVPGMVGCPFSFPVGWLGSGGQVPVQIVERPLLLPCRRKLRVAHARLAQHVPDGMVSAAGP